MRLPGNDGYGLTLLHGVLFDEAQRGLSLSVSSEVDAASGGGVALGEGELVGRGGVGKLRLRLVEGGRDAPRCTTRDVSDLLRRWLGELDELEAAVALLDVHAVEEEGVEVNVEAQGGVEALGRPALDRSRSIRPLQLTLHRRELQSPPTTFGQHPTAGSCRVRDNATIPS